MPDPSAPGLVLDPAAETAVPALISALRHDRADFRIGAAGALGKIGPGAEAAVLALINALRDDDPRVPSAAVGALRKIGPAALPELRWALSVAESYTVRRHAREAVATIEREG